MIEIEIKSPIENLDSFQQKLIALGAVKQEQRIESDIYFNHPSRDFGKTDEALRIRSCGNSAFLTYKGPRIGTRSKSRVEIEVTIHEALAMKELLCTLGFKEVLSVEKERTIYKINEITICLDEVKNLGNFVEFEKIGEDREAIENELFELAQILGLSQFERRSYLELLLQKSTIE